MRTPKFWYNEPNIISSALLPLSKIYALSCNIRNKFINPASTTAPVICIGNLVAGGAGKTLVALSLVNILKNHSVAFLTRGYGGSFAGPIKVNPETHSFKQVGDEALLLSRAAPTWLAHNRIAGAQAAIADGAKVIIMDDGFQNLSIIKNYSLIVIEGETGFGNYRLIPSGPLRESINDGLARTDATIIIGDDKLGVSNIIPESIPLLKAIITPTLEGKKISGKRVIAFAGIGQPKKFFKTLKEMECCVLSEHTFSDHHVYTPNEILNICHEASALDAIAVTTEKDWVRLPSEVTPLVKKIPVKLEWQDSEIIQSLLEQVINNYKT
ncbi:MAG: tetraacyldisaccharide 4'-kinase [Rhodospirillaceae bacterium]|nr:tetraacyldisaccharide 4'-kinase [Rhodospirillaceae bacterium]|tara:strand:- start:6257 stop:7234 length:978 start_codon:yes stop_codon:yes gene_type:complete